MTTEVLDINQFSLNRVYCVKLINLKEKKKSVQILLKRINPFERITTLRPFQHVTHPKVVVYSAEVI